MVYDDICLWITHTQQDAWPCMVTTRNCLNSSFYRQYYTSIQETDALMLTIIIGACTLSFFVDPNGWWNFRCSFTNSGARASTCKIRSTPSLINVEANNWNVERLMFVATTNASSRQLIAVYMIVMSVLSTAFYWQLSPQKRNECPGFKTRFAFSLLLFDSLFL